MMVAMTMMTMMTMMMVMMTMTMMITINSARYSGALFEHGAVRCVIYSLAACVW